MIIQLCVKSKEREREGERERRESSAYVVSHLLKVPQSSPTLDPRRGLVQAMTATDLRVARARVAEQVKIDILTPTQEDVSDPQLPAPL